MILGQWSVVTLPLVSSLLSQMPAPDPLCSEHCAARIGYNIATTATTQHHNATTPHLHQSGLHGTEHTSAQARFNMKYEDGEWNSIGSVVCVLSHDGQ